MLVQCEICRGTRILVDSCGESLCGWCDGTGLEELDVTDHEEAERAQLEYEAWARRRFPRWLAGASPGDRGGSELVVELPAELPQD